jgi:hypothetical protein
MAAWILWVALFVSTAHAARDIPSIDNSNFAEVTDAEEVWLLQFYASKSTHSMKFAAQWNELANSLKRVKVANVNVDTPKGLELLEKLKVRITIIRGSFVTILHIF